VNRDETRPRRHWWDSLWFAVLAIVLAVGGIVLVLYLFASAVVADW
jgi:hypothetical protein